MAEYLLLSRPILAAHFLTTSVMLLVEIGPGMGFTISRLRFGQVGKSGGYWRRTGQAVGCWVLEVCAPACLHEAVGLQKWKPELLEKGDGRESLCEREVVVVQVGPTLHSVLAVLGQLDMHECRAVLAVLPAAQGELRHLARTKAEGEAEEDHAQAS